jgi:energy-coupling factor transporter ATP-binding protein EcfA2
MTNNDILKKLRVALKLRDDHIVEILQLVDFKISKSELGAFFRKEDHPNYMECGDQVLRNFLNGLVIHLRGTRDNPKNPGEVLLGVSTPKNKGENKPGFKSKQIKKIDRALPNVKYKNKKKS